MPLGLTTALTAALAVVVAAWVYQSVKEADGKKEAAGTIAGKAKSGTGGALNVLSVTILMVAGWAATTFQTLGEFVAFLVSVGPEFPVLSAQLFVISLGALGLSDLVVIRTGEFLLVAVIVTVAAVVYRADLNSWEGVLR